MNFVATCLFGLERLVGEEIDALGYKRRETIDGRVYFEGDMSAVPRANINLRTAERVFIEICSFHAETFTELFEGVKKFPWETLIGEKDAFPVKGHSIRSKLYSIPDCQSIIKKAVVSRLQTAYKKEWFAATKRVAFENVFLNVPIGIEEFLKERFGDYMKIPNIEQIRREQHAGVWDTENDYKKYLKEQPTIPKKYVL